MRLVELADVSADDAFGAAARLAGAGARDALVLAQLGGATGALGAFQRPGRSGLERELRGFCGGRSAFAGEGTCALFAVACDVHAWLREAHPLPAARVLNRWVRGLLAGLRKLGVDASYPGRDFVAMDGARVAQVSLGRAASGAWILQAILATQRPFTTAEPAPAYPGLPPLPTAAVLPAAARARERLFAALAGGFAERFALALERAPLAADERGAGSAPPLPPLVEPELADLRCGGAVAIPNGELEAHVALDGSGALVRLRLRGDWIAARGDVQALEASLAGLAPRSAELRARCARWLADPAVLALGVAAPGSIADAIELSAR